MVQVAVAMEYKLFLTREYIAMLLTREYPAMLWNREYTAMLLTRIYLAKGVWKLLREGLEGLMTSMMTSMMMDYKVGGVSARFLLLVWLLVCCKN